MLQLREGQYCVSQNMPLDLIYAECRKCSAPLLWNKKQSLQVINALKISEDSISSSNMFLSEGCPCCSSEIEFFPVELIDVSKQKYNHNTSQKFWTTKK